MPGEPTLGLRFHRSFRLFPGVRLNLSKSGPSASFGAPGATFNVGPRGTRSTVGIPGTGLSYVKYGSLGASKGNREAGPVDQVGAGAVETARDDAAAAPEPSAGGRDFGYQLLRRIFGGLFKGGGWRGTHGG